MKKVFTFLFLNLLAFELFAQSNGIGVRGFRFLDISVPTRAVSLGGSSAALFDNDVNLIFSNPASVSHLTHNQLALTYNNYVADINFGNLAYSYALKNKSVFVGSLQYFNYGKFNGYNEYDEQTGKFYANDLSLNLSYSAAFNDTSFSYGVTLKTIYSYYIHSYALGNALDFGLNYHKRFFTASIVAQNVGKIWKPYLKGYSLTLPQNTAIAVSYKLPKAPFRLQLIYNDLLNWHLDYVSPIFDIQNNILTGEGVTINDKKKFGFILVKHLIISNEIILSKNFYLRVGYNFRRAQEMRLPDARPANGLSFGFEIKVSKFRISYAFSKMAVGGINNTFGLSMKLNEVAQFISKKNTEDNSSGN
ncbi:MAG TPA: type IX secretion system protein PorQ [Bacteroidia bacterium]|nr:type IX secretion system protein PorQ [Bacteroidia bacterium]